MTPKTSDIYKRSVAYLKPTKRLLRLGLALLGLALLVHAFEHLEFTAFESCISVCEHSHASSDSDSPAHNSHSHGCSSHEHSPAVLAHMVFFIPRILELKVPELATIAPPTVPQDIDQPPRIS